MAGGALGAMARAALLWPAAWSATPDFAIIVTAVVNVVGAFALGIVVGVAGSKHPAARAFVGTGVLGGFTSYSAFAVQLATSTLWVAVLLAVATVGLGLVAAGAGLWVGRRPGARAMDAAEPPE